MEVTKWRPRSRRACLPPGCDSADVLYEKKPYELSISLDIGDKS
jgi:hypothetical protein